MNAALSIRGLSKRFGSLVALDNVSFEVPMGSLFGLLGPNGAGKTTLLSIAAGFLKPSAGRVEVLGVDVRNTSPLHGRFSVLPQDAAFQSAIPVIDQLVMFGRLTGLDATAAERSAAEALEKVGLGDVARRNTGT